MGGAMGGQMAGMMNQMGQQVQGAMNTPPPIPQVQYMIASGGSPFGPFTIPQLGLMVQQGSFTPQTYVWKEGMAQWELAGNIPELAGLFSSSNIPPIPNGMPSPPNP